MNQITSILNRLNILEEIVLPNEANNLTIETQAGFTVMPQHEEPDNCPICLDTFNEHGLVILNCGHKLHLNCYSQLIRTPAGDRCPLCRSNIQPQRRQLNSPRARNNPNGRIFGYIDVEISDDEIDLGEPIQLLTILQSRVLEVMGNHPINIHRIHRRINRNNYRPIPYAEQTIRNNVNDLINYGLVRRRGREYLRL